LFIEIRQNYFDPLRKSSVNFCNSLIQKLFFQISDGFSLLEFECCIHNRESWIRGPDWRSSFSTGNCDSYLVRNWIPHQVGKNTRAQYLQEKNLSSEKISDKFRKFNIHKLFLEIRNFFWQVLMVLLSGNISANFSSEFLIETQFEKSVEFSEVRKFGKNSENFFCFFLLVKLRQGLVCRVWTWDWSEQLMRRWTGR
jgi:hypothetical protein